MKTGSLEATILFVVCVSLYSSGHWIGGTIVLLAFLMQCGEIASK